MELTIEQQSDKKFLEDQLAPVHKNIREATIMLKVWGASDVFKPQLDIASKNLAAWMAAEEEIKKQLLEFEGLI